MSEPLGDLRDQTFARATPATAASYPPVIIEGPAEVFAPSEVPADVRAAVRNEWASAWIRLTAQRLLSFAEENTSP
jgi:hypothetical protein